MPNHICQRCQKPFFRRNSSAKYCSHECYCKASRTVEERKCLICGTKFRPHANNRTGKYCSRKCRDDASREVSTKPMPCKQCGKLFTQSYVGNEFCSRQCYGKSITTIKPRKCRLCGKQFRPHHSAQVGIYCSTECRDTAQRSNHPRAGNNFSPSQKTKIKARDKNRCVICGSTKRLEVDHKKPVACGGTNALSNGQTLCHKCHVEKTTRELTLTRGAN